MLQVYVINISPVLDLYCKCFILMLYMLFMFQTYVTSVYLKYFIYFRRTLQVCLSVCCSCYIHIYCKRMFVNISHISDVCCKSAFMLQH
jgi:hypothetical protein